MEYEINVIVRLISNITQFTPLKEAKRFIKRYRPDTSPSKE